MTKNRRIIRLGIVGCGGVIQQRHLPALRKVSGVQITALADIDRARLERVAQEFDVDRCYTSHHDLLRSEAVDAIAVCTPPRFHAEIALAALDAAKHVFIEKPLALNLADCDLLLSRAASNGRLKVMVGFNMRWHRLVREAKAIIARGDLGYIKLVRTLFASGVGLREDVVDWRKGTETGGGALLDLGSHHFDLLHFLFDSEVQDVFALNSSSGDTASVLMRMNGGIQVVSAFSEGTGENHTIEVYGARGWLSLSCYRADGLEQFKAGWYPGTTASRLRKFAHTLRHVPRIIQHAKRGGDYVASYVEEWRHFVNAIEQDSPVACTLLDGRRAVEIAVTASEAIVLKRSADTNSVGID